MSITCVFTSGACASRPSIGFSLCDFDPNAYLKHTKEHIEKIVNNALNNSIPDSIALNVNIHAVSSEDIKGIKI